MWTSAQVTELAGDPSSLRVAQALADPRKWSGRGQNPEVAWGLCQGSASQPYRTCAEPEGPGFYCSCPSRRVPCKHALALLWLSAANQGQLPDSTEPPEWVNSWLEQRRARAVQKARRAETGPDLEAQARRAAQRQARVEEGVALLDQWLQDLVRGGLASVPALPYSHWEYTAARLVDTQTPGLARMVRRIPELLGRPDWPRRLAEHVARMHLLLQAFNRLDQLPVALQNEVRHRLGWTQNQEELARRAGLVDRWRVVGQRFFEEENLRTARSWWFGETSGRAALVLDFAAGGRPLPPQPELGSVWQAEMVFYEGVEAQRALLKSRQPLSTPPDFSRALSTFSHLLEEYAQALALNPWLESFPVLLQQVRPAQEAGVLLDSDDRALPFWPRDCQWALAAVSGGAGLTVFGEWDGHALRLLSLTQGQRCYGLDGVVRWTN